MNAARPHVVIIGGGFGGLYAAKGLGKSPVRITLVDRSNHHLFQPLLYEVATAALSPAEIAAPIRAVFSKQRNTAVLLGNVVEIDTAHRIVHLADGAIAYDYLVVAAGATHSYFGNDDWARFAPGLKTIDDALEIRQRFLLAFETAEREADDAARRTLLTFVVIGAGPTGVELAGTMAELARKAIPRDFRTIDASTARVILVEAMDRVLPTFPPDLSEKARRSLEELGVEVRLNSPVTKIDGDGVCIGSERINTENIIWAAGVQASPLGKSLGAPTDRAGRVMVQSDLSIPGHPEVFVIGDLASVVDPDTNKPVPGVAPAAIQMGKYVARVIDREVRGKALPQQRRPFHYRDKGMLATIGRAKAVAKLGKLKFSGLIAWLLWALVHVMYLIGFRNRLIVMLQWAWAYIAFQRGARVITGPVDLELRQPRTDSAAMRAAKPARTEPEQRPVSTSASAHQHQH